MKQADRWKAVEELFHRALEVPEPERIAFLETNSGGDPEIIREVRSLLRSDHAASAGFTAAAVKKALLNFHVAQVADSAPGRRIGPYRLVREIGRGGMGAVYLAIRDDDTFEKKVAVKLVHRGMDTDFILSRFRRERQILASLEHPNIARLLDGGATEDGLPYLVMEYVQGVSITEYADKNQLSVEQRIRLFLQICDAVEYAHRNFIVHRDLKPSNILVDDNGRPKLLDFGISKLLVLDGRNGTETITQDVRMLTPEYASPEQVHGDPITAASDIYSLGAVLFELLTGDKPQRADTPTAPAADPGRTVRDRQPTTGKLPGDLNNILLLAMRQDARRRYSSVQDFASDLRRYLEDLPVAAPPYHRRYRLTTFMLRNWAPLTALAAVIFILLFAALMAQRDARIARMHFHQVRRLANTFITGIHDEIHNLPGSMRARQMIVKTGLEYLESLAAHSQGDPDLQRELGAGYMRIGDVQGSVLEANLGDTKGALESYDKALKLLQTVAKERQADYELQNDILSVYRKIGDVYGYTKSTDAALQAYAHAGSLGEALLTKRPDDDRLRRTLADLQQAQGRTLRLADDLSGAFNASNRALELYREAIAKNPDDLSLHRDIANTVSSAGMALMRLGRRDEASAHFSEAVQHFEYLKVRDPRNTSAIRGLMLAYSHLGDLLSEPGIAKPSEAAGALNAYLKMYEVAQRLHNADPADFRALGDIAIATMRVANVTTQPEEKLHRYGEALGYLRKASQINQDLMLQMNMAFVETRMGDILRSRGDMKEAVHYYKEAVPIGERLFLNDPKNSSVRRTLIQGLRRLGEDAASRGSAKEALDVQGKLIRLADEVKQPAAPPRVQALVPLGYGGAASIADSLGDKKMAREWYQLALSEFRRLQELPGFAYRKEIQELEGLLSRLPK